VPRARPRTSLHSAKLSHMPPAAPWPDTDNNVIVTKDQELLISASGAFIFSHLVFVLSLQRRGWTRTTTSS